MRHAARAVVLAGTTALITMTTTVRAGDVAAEALFKEGRALLASGRIEEACDRFRRSAEIEPRVGTLLNVGECFERTRQYASAWGAFREAANLAARGGDDREGLAREKAALVERRAARLTLTVAPPSRGASVTRNGVRVDPAAFDTAIPVDPGAQDIVVAAPDRKPWRARLQLLEGESGRLAVPPLERLPAAPPPRPDAADPGAGTQAKVGIGLEIGGGVTLATGLLFGALAMNKWSSVEDTCPNARCPSAGDRDRLESDRRRASTFATVSTVTTIAGGAVLAAGVVIHLTAPARGVTLTPAVDRNGGAFVATLQL
jgi:hypothetical protein